MDGLSPGRVLAERYVLIEPLRRGGGAVVWRAQDRQKECDVAIKFVDRDDAPEQLTQEYERLGRIDHPAVVRALALEPDGPFLVLELLDGPELRSMMGADHRVWIPALRGALDGLAAAHAAGVAHGDLSLSNILIGDDGRARLIDFGAGRQSDTVDDLRALGALMHRLITGQDPQADGRLLQDKPGPQALRSLVLDLLRTPTQLTLAEVRSQLDEILRAGGERFERITATDRRSVARPAPVAPPPAAPRRWGPFVVLALVALAVVLAVFAWGRFGTQRTVELSTDTVEEAGSRLASQREEAAQLRAAVSDKWRRLQALDVSKWAELRADRGLAHFEQGAQLADKLDSLAALRELRSADELFSALLAEAPEIAAFHRQAGLRAMDRGDAESAETHLRILLAIEPGDESVRELLARTRHLEPVIGLWREARQLEAAGEVAGALELLQQAAQIDSGNAELEAEIARLEQDIGSERFALSMTQAYEALRSGRYSQAREAIAAAATLRPEAPEVGDVRTQLQVAEREAAIRALRARAEQAQQAQDWEQAIGLYGELLQLDPTLVFARQSRDRARLLASLTARAQALLDSTEFERQQPRRQARALIDQVNGLQAEAPALRSLAERLERRLELAREPVPVRLQSDNQTEVTIFRVGRIGRFASHEMELLPGRYTVLGVRDGYRDVRRELVVPAGEPVGSFVIQCEERI